MTQYAQYSAIRRSANQIIVPAQKKQLGTREGRRRIWSGPKLGVGWECDGGGGKEERKLISEDTNGEFRRRLPLEREREREPISSKGENF